MHEKVSVFLSYGSEDRSIVQRVEKELKEIGLRPWLDVQEISPGERVIERLESGLDTAQYFLPFWSVHAAKSRWVQSEIDVAFMNWADTRSVLIVPVLLDDTPLPSLLKPISRLDFREGIEEGFLRLRKFFGHEGFGPARLPRLLSTESNCVELLGGFQNRELRLRLKQRLGLNDVREIWMDVFESRLDDDFPGMPLGLSVGEMILRADERRLREKLLHSICANREDVSA